MGKMKEIYIDLVNKYGKVPDGFSLAEYQLQKEMEIAEQQEIEERLKKEKDDEESK